MQRGATVLYSIQMLNVMLNVFMLQHLFGICVLSILTTKATCQIMPFGCACCFVLFFDHVFGYLLMLHVHPSANLLFFIFDEM